MKGYTPGKCGRCGDIFMAEELDADGLCGRCAKQQSRTTKEECPRCASRDVTPTGTAVQSLPGEPLEEDYQCNGCGRLFHKQRAAM